MITIKDEPTGNNNSNASSGGNSVRVYDGAVSIVNGEMRHHGVTRSNSADLQGSGEGILATARHPGTGGPARVLNDDTLVTYQGMQTTLASAAQLGLVQKNERGEYVLAAEQPSNSADEAAAAAAEKEQADQSAPIAFSEADEARMAEFVSAIPSQMQDKIIAEIVAHDAVSSSTGSAIGMDQAAFTTGVQHIQGLMQQQADDYVSKHGVNPEHFYEWLRENDPEAVREAKLAMAYQRNPHVALGKHLDRYFLSTAPDAATLNDAGLKTMTGPDGELLVNLRGMWMSVAAAARSGLL